MFLTISSIFLHVTVLCFGKVCRAQVLNLSYHELSFSLSNSLAYTVSDNVRLISFLREFFYSSYHDLESC
jgi:hypothetical protein